jgi:ankyrin repeat protein
MDPRFDAMLEAAYYGHTLVVQLLLDHGVALHAGNDPVFHIAFNHGHKSLQQLLFDRGARL